MKYRENMTQAELSEFMAEINALDAVYASAAEHDAQNMEPMPDEWEDEMSWLKKAALCRGRP